MGATKCLSTLSLACLTMMIFYSTPATACLCPEVTLQEKLHAAKYVDLVRVLDKQTLANGTVANNVTVIFNHKLPLKGVENNSGTFVLNTPCVEDSRTVYLEKGKHYVIAGSGVEVNLCNFIVEFKSMTREHMDEINIMYRNQYGRSDPR